MKRLPVVRRQHCRGLFQDYPAGCYSVSHCWCLEVVWCMRAMRNGWWCFHHNSKPSSTWFVHHLGRERACRGDWQSDPWGHDSSNQFAHHHWSHRVESWTWWRKQSGWSIQCGGWMVDDPLVQWSLDVMIQSVVGWPGRLLGLVLFFLLIVPSTRRCS